MKIVTSIRRQVIVNNENGNTINENSNNNNEKTYLKSFDACNEQGKDGSHVRPGLSDSSC